MKEKEPERRQTFVRFRFDESKNLNTKREPANFIPLEILNDDSINLSTEIPKIAPPKIIHTPIRPNRQALGTILNGNSMFSSTQCDDEKFHSPLFTPATPIRPKKVAHQAAQTSPGGYILALGQQISRIESTVNELKQRTDNCQCGALAPQALPTIRRRPTTRAAARAAQTKAASDKKRPSADADKNTLQVVDNLIDEIGVLKEKLEEMSLRR